MTVKENSASIKIRYTAEALSCEGNLSCGSNMQFANLISGEMVLDLGCGRGKETIAAAIAVAPHGKSFGLDITDKMIEVAKKSALEENITNAYFTVAEIENLPYADEKFDVVLSNCVINHAKNKLQVYKEIYRVLKPGGRMLISDIVALEQLPPEIRNDAKAWANCFAGAEDKDIYFETIANAGFQSVDIVRWREYKKEGYLIASVTFNALKSIGGEKGEESNK